MTSRRTIAIGDIHGCSAALDALLVAINPHQKDTIVTLGDYINRGPDTRVVIGRLIDLGRRCRLVPILGNIERLGGPVLLEFGASWCGHCQALAPKLARLLEGHPSVHHVKVEDGPGKRLGRSFGVKLWPTLGFLRGGQVVKQVSRPGIPEVREGLEAIDGT